MREEGIEDADLLAADYFLWAELQHGVDTEEARESGEEERVVKEKPEVVEFKHNDIRDKLAEIGAFLGFDTRIEQKVAEFLVVILCTISFY